MVIPANANNVVTYAYDDFGNRYQKTIEQLNNGTINETYYINNGLTVLNELDSNGNITKSIVQGLSTIGEIDSNGIITYLHQDSLGSTALATGPIGEISQQYEYEPFGQLTGALVSLSFQGERRPARRRFKVVVFPHYAP